MCLDHAMRFVERVAISLSVNTSLLGGIPSCLCKARHNSNGAPLPAYVFMQELTSRRRRENTKKKQELPKSLFVYHIDACDQDRADHDGSEDIVKRRGI